MAFKEGWDYGVAFLRLEKEAYEESSYIAFGLQGKAATQIFIAQGSVSWTTVTTKLLAS